MKKLEEILREWESDAKVDILEPSREIIQIPILHSKYLNIMTDHKLALIKTNFSIARLKKKKWEYYGGKMSKEELDKEGWEPFQYRLKSDIGTYIESDNDLITLMEKKAYHEEAVSVCQSIMKELGNRTYQLREHMTMERFIAGGR